ncbi:ATP-binding cassette domain-containing protein [Aquicoccus sp. SCR17]|nr:ATP-binding cassette domain-containing protein [Carideicomes alvinocaridis]
MLDIENLRVEYISASARHLAVDDISLSVKDGEFFTLLGPSGCGKTTTLRCIAGLETPQGGRISIDGNPVFDATSGKAMPTQKRDISMVFQSYAIWPNMSVAENVGFPLEVKGMRRAERRRIVDRTLEMVGLTSQADRPATMLSGGQQQRVALARAVIKEAKVLLLDEPLSNLDAKLREQMRAELRDLQRNVGTTSIYVTHDQDEALSLSDRIAVMHGGKVIEVGTPHDLYLKPRNLFTAQFIGEAQLFPCRPLERVGDGFLVETSFGKILAKVNTDLGGEATHVFVRPEHTEFVDPSSNACNVLSGRIVSTVFSGKHVEYDVETTCNQRLSVSASSANLRTPGDEVSLRLPPDNAVLLAGTA